MHTRNEEGEAFFDDQNGKPLFDEILSTYIHQCNALPPTDKYDRSVNSFDHISLQFHYPCRSAFRIGKVFALSVLSVHSYENGFR